ELPQARTQPAASRDVPGRGARRCGAPHPMHGALGRGAHGLTAAGAGSTPTHATFGARVTQTREGTGRGFQAATRAGRRIGTTSRAASAGALSRTRSSGTSAAGTGRETW